MKIKNKILSLLFTIGFITPTFGQKWNKDSTTNIYSLDHLFFSQVRKVFIGANSKTFVITEHRSDFYWDKKYKDSAELLVSYIDNSGITFLKKIEFYAKYPEIKFYNNKYYIFDRDIKQRNKKVYYSFFIYNSDWTFNKTIELNDLQNQEGYRDFVVDKNENLYFVTNPYSVNYKARGFIGNYLLKISSNGQFIKKILFKNCIPSDFIISNDTLQLTLNKQAIESHFLYNDSSLQIKVDTNLNNIFFSSKKFIPKDKKIDKEVLLTNGGKVVYIDSTYNLTPSSWTSTFKIALFNKQNIRKWTFEPSNRWFYSTPKPLQNGSFITKVDKLWDSTSVVIFDTAGNERQIKSFLMNADTRIIRYHIEDFFEINNNEIYLFFIKELPTSKEELYFEIIKL